MSALPLSVFDVIETLLNLETMEPTLQRSSARRAPCACGLLTSSIPPPRGGLLRPIHRNRLGGDEDAGRYA
jgi:hypothetical protein